MIVMSDPTTSITVELGVLGVLARVLPHVRLLQVAGEFAQATQTVKDCSTERNRRQHLTVMV